jgi:hypothetical protein
MRITYVGQGCQGEDKEDLTARTIHRYLGFRITCFPAAEGHGLCPWMNVPTFGRDVALLGRDEGCHGLCPWGSTGIQREVVVMIRAKLWFRCAAMHDPVTPMVVQPALIGWEAKKRRVDLTIDRAFNGEELVRRMKGWVTVDPAKVIDVVNRFGRLKVLDDRELVVEVEKREDLQNIEKALGEAFGNEMNVEEIVKSSPRNV